MIAAWMLYCSLCALGLAGAALLAERALVAGGGPVRSVWIGAVALSLLVPAAAFRYASRPSIVVPTAVASPEVAVDSPLGAAADVTLPAAAAARPQTTRWTWRAAMGVLSRANTPLAITWLALSSALALYFLFGVVALARLRRRWQRQEVLGVPVLISDRTGPAIVGVVAPAIVMPEWALAMEPHQLSLMLRHEQEHRRVGDAQLMTAAHLALIAMPWNAALWWLIVRLGMAVELDCDARVLRDADARSYGDLLLEVARPRRGLPLLGATAFAERAGQLERRIRAIARRRNRASRGARAAAAFIGLAALTVAWAAPRPSQPPRPASSQNVQAAPSIAVPTPGPSRSSLTTARKNSAPADLESVAPANGRPATRINDNTLRTLDAVPPVQLTATRVSSPMVDSVFARLFAGMALSTDQELAARQLIGQLELRQVVQSTKYLTETLKGRFAFMAVQTQRDSDLRALLNTDSDRAVFDARVTQDLAAGRGGARGRSGNGASPPDGVGGGRVGRSGGDPSLITGRARGGGGGGGGRGGSPVVRRSTVTFGIASVDEAFARLFGGLALTPDQEASARTILTNARGEMAALIPEPPMSELELLPDGSVLMRPESRSNLLTLLTNDADRSALYSRIAIETRIVVRDPPGPPPPPTPIAS